MKTETYITLDATDIAELVGNNEVSPKEMIQVAYNRLLEVNGQLNAVVHTRYERALKEADDTKGIKEAFSGAPILLKNLSQSLIGEPLTASSRLLKDNIAQVNSNIVSKLLKGGTVVLGSTNTPEFGLKNISEPALYGPTRNPCNHHYSAGGSSGGAAAAVAGGIVPVAGASDGGGSIRIPASFTGLVGLKPTRGRTPVGPGVGRQWQGAAIDFVLTKSVRDCAGMLDLLQVVQPEAAFQTPIFQKGYRNVMEESFDQPLKIGYSLQSPVHTPVSEEAKRAVTHALKFLESLGHEVEEVDIPIDGVELMEQYYLMNAGEMAGLLQSMEEVFNRPFSSKDMEFESWMLYEAGKNVRAADFTRSLATWDLAATRMMEFHLSHDFFITPTTAFTAPKIGELTHSSGAQEKYIENMRSSSGKKQLDLIYEMFLPSLTYTPFTQLANLTGQPAISLPLHKGENDLPIGVQAMAMKGREDQLLKLAKLFEQSNLWQPQRSKKA
ncbi:amidase [Alteribacter aurantiacus]|uniref:amidase n=1 Tax=Alteribacter aurantiacus TaxID=254410 RepID=UPI000409C08D|nr:amidase [Alteribacter aurantiacus]